MGDLYDNDILLWSEQQGALLRRIAAGEPVNTAPDWPHIAEEIEALGRSERSAFASHLRTISEHLMKLQASPATAPRAAWQETILRARAEAEQLLEDSPSLRPSLPEVIDRQSIKARRLVAAALALHGETTTRDLSGISYTPDQVLGGWFRDDE